MPLQQLFGGAITAEFPENLIDASTLREVPSTQEVFVSKNSSRSIIIELLELAPPQDDTSRAILTHLHELHRFDNGSTKLKGDSNGFQSSSVEKSEGYYLWEICNVGNVDILIALCLLRLPENGCDVVISGNWPLTKDQVEEIKGSNELKNELKEFFNEVLNIGVSLKIQDYGLFC